MLKRRVESRTNTVARTFDRVCSVLTSLGYLEGDTVTERGSHLRRIYTDMDLVAAESLREGLWDGLTPSELAAVLSSLVYEARRADDASAPRVPGGPVAGRARRDRAGLARARRAGAGATSSSSCASPTSASPGPPTAGPRATTSTTCSAGPDLAAGDFVRWMKQLLDLAGQVADAAGDTPLRKTARDAVQALKRGSWPTRPSRSEPAQRPSAPR